MRALRLLIFIAFLLLYTEGSIRVLNVFPSTSLPRVLRGLQSQIREALRPEDFQWKQEFVDLVEAKRKADSDFFMDLGKGLFVPHTTRGWTPRPNTRLVSFGYRYRINSKGERAPVEFVQTPNRFSVLILGDSFTFGTEANDEFTWPNLLREHQPKLNIANLSVAGYGIDQMLITLREEIDRYKPDLVVVGAIADDLDRVVFGFRGFKKPRFDLIDDKLVLGNSPIGSLEEVYRETKKELQEGAPFFQSVSLYRILRSRARMRKLPALDKKILEALVETSRRHGADFLLVSLDRSRSRANAFLRNFSEHENVSYLDLSETFPKNFLVNEGKHYLPEEAGYVSRSVQKNILDHPSYRKWLAHQALP